MGRVKGKAWQTTADMPGLKEVVLLRTGISQHWGRLGDPRRGLGLEGDEPRKRYTGIALKPPKLQRCSPSVSLAYIFLLRPTRKLEFLRKTDRILTLWLGFPKPPYQSFPSAKASNAWPQAASSTESPDGPCMPPMTSKTAGSGLRV